MLPHIYDTPRAAISADAMILPLALLSFFAIFISLLIITTYEQPPTRFATMRYPYRRVYNTTLQRTRAPTRTRSATSHALYMHGAMPRLPRAFYAQRNNVRRRSAAPPSLRC